MREMEGRREARMFVGIILTVNRRTKWRHDDGRCTGKCWKCLQLEVSWDTTPEERWEERLPTCSVVELFPW